ncbi:MAG: DUF4382 domain-containing protein [Dehalococcoidales bacterium]|nr:DUF4382 domain-containing protein [Dehalococcoidales bacterium]
MKRKIVSLMATALSVFSAIVLAACTVPGGTTGPTGSTGPVASAGTVQMWVTDAPRTDNVSEIWVTVSEVKIHKAGSGNVSDNASDNVSDNTSGNVTGNTSEGQEDTSPENAAGWITINITGANRFDLLTLRGDGNGSGLQQILATANLAAGRYTQIRMSISKVEVKLNGVLEDATIPSGKLRFVHPFEIQSGNVTKLLFDFDADKFVTVTGNPNDPKILVKPVAKLIVSAPHGTDTDHPTGNQSGNHTSNQTGAQDGAQNAPQGGPQTDREELKITTTGLPNGTVNTTYNAALAATGGTGTYTWSLQGGVMPAGLSLSAAGVISGTPTSSGNYNIVAKVTDNSTPAKIDTAHLTIKIN